MATLYLSGLTGNDATAQPNDRNRPWATTIVSAFAVPGDTVWLLDEVRIEKNQFAWHFPDGVSLIGEGRTASTVNNWAVYGIEPGSDNRFESFSVINRDMDNNHQWNFLIPLNKRSERCIWRDIYGRGDSDSVQAGSDLPCSGEFWDCDFESKADGFIFSGRGSSSCIYQINRSRIATIGPSKKLPEFLAQVLQVAEGARITINNSQLITTWFGVVQTPNSFVELHDTPVKHPNGSVPPVPYFTRSDVGVATLLVRN